MVRTQTKLAAGAAILALAAVTAGALPANASKGDRPSDKGQTRNVILLIGDGMGDSELSSTRYYEYGAAGRLAMDDMPERSAVTTWSIDEATLAPDYVPDSASTATAWSTGIKTSDGRIGTTAGADEDITNIMELAKTNGMLVGNVSTARLTDATPAGAMAHVAARGCEGPTQTSASCPQDATENGGPGSIAEQSIDLGVDVLLGGGADRYDQQDPAADAGTTVTGSAQADGYDVARTSSDLDDAQLPVLGLFSSGHLPTERTGPQAAPGGVDAECVANPDFTSDIPTLDTMTSVAIDLLDRSPGNGNGRANGQPGFFLQVEGASIDKQDHAANPCAQIGETVAFDRAVQVALDFAAGNGNTTVIVTADHSHTSQIIPAGDTDSPGATATLITADGRPMQLNYATSPVTGSQDHLGANVPYFEYGPGAEGVPALIDQTNIFTIITSTLRLN